MLKENKKWIRTLFTYANVSCCIATNPFQWPQQIIFLETDCELLTRYEMYGPRMPNAFENIIPIDIPVWRRQVGYVSMACKLIAKNVMVDQNLTMVIKVVDANWYSSAGKKRRKMSILKLWYFIMHNFLCYFDTNVIKNHETIYLLWMSKIVGTQNTAHMRNDRKLVNRRPILFPRNERVFTVNFMINVSQWGNAFGWPVKRLEYKFWLHRSQATSCTSCHNRVMFLTQIGSQEKCRHFNHAL